MEEDLPEGACDMRKSFDELWAAMEARRQQVGAGQGSPACLPEQTWRARRRGCPDEEGLCGWVDGELRRRTLRRWLKVWQHVEIRRCRACRAEVEALAEANLPAQVQWSWLTSAVKRVVEPSHAGKTSLAWASPMLLIAVGLLLWSFGPRTHGTRLVGVERSWAPVMEEAKTPSVGDEPNLEAPPEPVIWGD
jgi:hypothetical protein